MWLWDFALNHKYPAPSGICYQDGLGVVLNALGVAYAYGRGIDRDIETGLDYFRQAVEKGCEVAKEHLAYLQAHGQAGDE